jgi:quercetin dioxygenase-like cupin family protein
MVLSRDLSQPTIDLSEQEERCTATAPPILTAIAAIAAVGALAGAALVVVSARATEPSGVTTTMIGVGRFGEIDAKAKTDINPGARTDFWKARIKTKGSSDLHVLENTIAPGGTFGWHRHPGPSLVIVKTGTATFYLAADRTCTPHVVPAGSGFVTTDTTCTWCATRAASTW